MLAMMQGPRRYGVLELPAKVPEIGEGYEPGQVTERHLWIEARIHGQTQPEVAEGIAKRIGTILGSLKQVSDFKYIGIEGEQKPPKDAKWTGREPFAQVAQTDEDGTIWVRADYFVHALSFSDLGIRDENTEMLLVGALQTWPQRAQAKEAIRRVREMYDIMRKVRETQNAAAQPAAA